MTPNASDILSKERSSAPPSATHLKLPAEIGTDYSFKRRVVWFNAIGFLFLHLAGVYGVYMWLFAKWYTIIWMVGLTFISGEGVTIGAHRLYSHRAFKATFPVRLFLLILHTIAGQNCLYIWVRDHRQHHKYSDTDADPHNANRGFFFSHIGWLMSRKHPAVISKGKTIDMSDLEADRLVMLQKKYYKPLYVIFALALPILIPVYFWDESLYNSVFVSYFARYVIMLNVTWLVNSAAHFYGTKPYDKNMRPVESALVSFLSQGEGWHNYHHAFPWDYRAAELGSKYSMTTFLINLLASLNLVYDLRTTPHRLIEHRVLRTGDGSHKIQTDHDEEILSCEINKIDNESDKLTMEKNQMDKNKNDTECKKDGIEKDSDGLKIESDANKNDADSKSVGIEKDTNCNSDGLENHEINKKDSDDDNKENIIYCNSSDEIILQNSEIISSSDVKIRSHENNCDNGIISKMLLNNDKLIVSENSFERLSKDDRNNEKETMLTNRSAMKRHIAVQG